jgi:hypothetical protein
MPQPAEFDGFYYDPASNLLAYHAVTAVICQRSPPPLREVPTLANGIDAESSKSTGSGEPVFTIGGCPTDCSFETGDFLVEKEFMTALTIIFKAQHSTNHNL